MTEVGNGIVGSGRKARRDGALGEKQMVNNFVKRRTLRRIGSEDLLDEFLDVCRDRTVVWELIFVVTNTPVNTVRPEDCELDGATYL